ncbi:MAG: AraC family transcriptional regulator [Faecalibacterium sp.]
MAIQTGFVDPHYFSKVFKKSTGLTPKEYKQQLLPT